MIERLRGLKRSCILLSVAIILFETSSFFFRFCNSLQHLYISSPPTEFTLSCRYHGNTHFSHSSLSQQLRAHQNGKILNITIPNTILILNSGGTCVLPDIAASGCAKGGISHSVLLPQWLHQFRAPLAFRKIDFSFTLQLSQLKVDIVRFLATSRNGFARNLSISISSCR